MVTNNWKTLDACRVGKNESRETLKNINITDQHIESTNGHIAIRFTKESISLPTIANGAYKVISATKCNKLSTEIILEHQPEAQFPDTKRLFPENATAGSKITIEIMPEKDAPYSITSAIIQMYKLTGNAYANEYVKKLSILGAYWGIYSQGDNRAIYLENSAGTISALIMPFKIN